MTTIVFVRHGESDANAFIHNDPNDPDLEAKINSIADPQLTETGKKQAQCVGEFLSERFEGKYVHLVTSLFSRTIQTSEPFHKLHGKLIKIYDNDPLLQEYSRPGKYHEHGEHGEHGEHVNKKTFKTHHTWKSFTDDVEIFVDVLEHMANCDSTPIVIFGHSLFLSVMLSYIGSR